ncbi:hypothetical protein DIPPA_22820 [Diplonema papillatum]|nr:hypothetical protein DIPPA_22820 [Diplonema papillatum]
MLAALRAVQWDCRVTKCFVTGRRTNLVVNASTDPPAEVVKRANRTPLYIRRVRVGDVPSGTKHWKGRIPNARLPQGEQDAPPAARQEDVAPSAKRKAGEMEGEAAGSAEGEMQVDAHVHNWGDDVEKTKVAWKCSRCNGGKGKNTLQRKCACGARVCHECYRTREKAGSG